MQLTKGTITKIVNEANKLLNVDRLYLKKAYEDDTRCNIHFYEENNLKDNMFVIRIDKINGLANIDSVANGNIKTIAKIEVQRSTELLALITVILSRCIKNKGPFKVKLLKSQNGWSNLKLIMAEDYATCCVYTNTLKVAMRYGLVQVLNAKLDKRGGISTLKNTLPHAGYVMHPEYSWEIKDWYIDNLKIEGYIK